MTAISRRAQRLIANVINLSACKAQQGHHPEWDEDVRKRLDKARKKLNNYIAYLEEIERDAT